MKLHLSPLPGSSGLRVRNLRSRWPRILALAALPLGLAATAVHASNFTYTLSGLKVTGGYQATGGPVENFTDADLTFSATADGANTFSVTSFDFAGDQFPGTYPAQTSVSANYLLLPSVNITLSGGGLVSPLNLTAGLQTSGSSVYSFAVISIKLTGGDPSVAPSYGDLSMLGFSLVNTTTDGFTTLNPRLIPVAASFDLGGISLFTTLQSATTLGASIPFIFPSLPITAASGEFGFTGANSNFAGTMTIAAAGGPTPSGVPEPANTLTLALAGLTCAAWLRRRRE
jgi:hypothetical protein